MKKYFYIALFAVAVACYVYVQQRRIDELKAERDTYRQNTHALLAEVERYRVMDSLNVVSIEELCLTVDEYRRCRREDMALIERLKVDRARLQRVSSVQTEAVYELNGAVRDSVRPGDRFAESFVGADAAFDSIVRGGMPDTLRCVSIGDRWFDLEGCVDGMARFTRRFFAQ
jgi:hypothetical protein